jgi:UDP-glucose 4-epimerase
VLVDGTFNVIESCVNAGVRKIIAASSASVYGTAELFPTPEDHHPYNNRTLYGAGKVSNEQLLSAFRHMCGLDYVALRYFNVFGPRMDIHGAYTEVLVRWLDCIDRGEPPVIFGDGTQTMDFVYVEDVALANILAVQHSAAGEVYNIGSGCETSLTELLETLLRITGAELRPRMLPERKVDSVRRRVASTEKAERQLGFVTRVSLEEGLRRLVTWRKERAGTRATSPVG